MQRIERRAVDCCSGVQLPASLFSGCCCTLEIEAFMYMSARSFYRQVAGETRTKQELEQQVKTMGGLKFPALCDRLSEEYGAHPASLLI